MGGAKSPGSTRAPVTQAKKPAEIVTRSWAGPAGWLDSPAYRSLPALAEKIGAAKIDYMPESMADRQNQLYAEATLADGTSQMYRWQPGISGYWVKAEEYMPA